MYYVVELLFLRKQKNDREGEMFGLSGGVSYMFENNEGKRFINVLAIGLTYYKV